mgnify:FL=1
MGVIKRQGAKHSSVRVASVMLGAFSSLFIYPLDLSTYGTLVFLLSFASFLHYPLTLGFGQTMVKFFHEFERGVKKSSFFFTQSLIQICTLVITCSLFYFLQDSILNVLDKLQFNVQIFKENELLVIFLVILVSFRTLWQGYAQTIKRIVVPEFLYNMLYKIGLPLLICLSAFRILGIYEVKWLFVLLIAIINLSLFIYFISLGRISLRLDFRKYTSKRVNRMGDFALFGMFTALGGQLAFKIDNIMIAPLIGVEENGIYSIMVFMASTLLIPMVSVDLISNPIISKAMAINNRQEVDKIYKKGSNIFGAIGILLFFLIWIHLPVYFNLSAETKAIEVGRSVFLLLGFSKLFDCFTSVNSAIIKFSKYFRFNLFTTLTLGGLNIWLNYELIPIFGIKGVAMATAISLASFNLVKLFFVWKVLGYQPFRKDTIGLVVLFLFCMVLNHFFSKLVDDFFLRLIINYLLLFFTLLLPIYLFNLAPDLKEMMNQVLNKTGLRKKN